MSINRGMDKDVVCVYNAVLLSCGKSEITPFAAIWVNLEIIILGEINQKEKEIYHTISLYM